MTDGLGVGHFNFAVYILDTSRDVLIMNDIRLQDFCATSVIEL
jgi:hypothetical protein